MAAPFAIVGAGWRTHFYLRIAQLMRSASDASGVVARDPAKGETLRDLFGVPILRDVSEVTGTRPDFVVTSVGWGDNPGVVRRLAEEGHSILSETPPAPNVEAMRDMADLLAYGPKIQVAEQVALRPAYQGLKATRARLGTVDHVQVSVAHGYHGVSVIEELLGVVGQRPTIRATNVGSRIVAGPDREGAPREERTKDSTATLAWLDYGDGKTAVFDFTGDQYFAWIRASRALVRGDRGEADLSGARWLADFETPLSAEFVRRETGRGDDLYDPSLSGITLGDEWLYRNPFAGARLSDDEIAIATMMECRREGRGDLPARPRDARLPRRDHDRPRRKEHGGRRGHARSLVLIVARASCPWFGEHPAPRTGA